LLDAKDLVEVFQFLYPFGSLVFLSLHSNLSAFCKPFSRAHSCRPGSP
jgi:hypothetical protein